MFVCPTDAVEVEMGTFRFLLSERSQDETDRDTELSLPPPEW